MNSYSIGYGPSSLRLSIAGYWDDLLSGQPWGTADSEAALGASLDAQQQQIIQGKIADGTYSGDTAQQVQQDYANQAETTLTDQTESITGGFLEGLGSAVASPVQTVETGLEWEGSEAGNIAGGVANAASNAVKNAVTKTAIQIPWWVWIIAAGVLFFYLDGPAWIAPYLHGKKKK